MNDVITRGVFGKAEIAQMVSDAVMKVTEGEVSPLDIYLQCKAMEKVAKDIRTKVEEEAMEEADKYGKSFRMHDNVAVEICEAGARYDFTHSADWNDLQTKIEALKEQQTAIEEGLKRASATVPYFDKLTGELIEYPAPRSSKTTIKVSFK